MSAEAPLSCSGLKHSVQNTWLQLQIGSLHPAGAESWLRSNNAC